MDLIEYLRWGSPPDSDPYREAFDAAAERRMSEALSHLGTADPELAAQVLEILEELPAANVVRIARAPELAYRLRAARLSSDGVEGLVGFVCAAVRAELLALAGRGGGDGPAEAWTALGDCRLFAAGERGAERERWVAEPAPTVGGIPIDLASPHGRADVSRRFELSQEYTAEERREVVRRLEESFPIVSAAGSEVRRFVESFTRVFVPLAVADEEGKFGSFSSSWYPGRSVLVNVHRPEMTRADLASAIVHEAIHSLIDVSELAGKLLADEEGANPPVASPWTGNEISLQSLLDAYFVWFGLRGFWGRVLAADLLEASVAEWWVAECGRGFGPAFRDVVGGDKLALVHPFCRERIEAVREAALEELGG